MQSLFLNSLGGPGGKGRSAALFSTRARKQGHCRTQLLCTTQTPTSLTALKHDLKRCSENGANGSCVHLGHWEKTEMEHHLVLGASQYWGAFCGESCSGSCNTGNSRDAGNHQNLVNPSERKAEYCLNRLGLKSG